MQLHRRSFPLDLEIITLLRVLFGGGLRETGSTRTSQPSRKVHKLPAGEPFKDAPEVVVGELLQCVGLRLVLLVIKVHVGQVDGLSPLVGGHGDESLTRRGTGVKCRKTCQGMEANSYSLEQRHPLVGLKTTSSGWWRQRSHSESK